VSYHLKLQEFEGPLDLLLHLIKKEEAELDKISLSKITDQYLDYISSLSELDLDQASEFVLLAATLLQLKARSVLPRPAAVSEDFEEEPAEWLNGPRSEADLAERLKVYRQFKQIAEHLQDREETWSRVYTRSAINEALAEGFSASIPAGSISLGILCNAFQKILDNLETLEPYLELAQDQVTIMEQMQYILERVGTAGTGVGAGAGGGADAVFGGGKPVTFNSLFSHMSTRGEIVVTFLALLELIRCQQVRVIQERALGPILVERATGSLGAGFSADFNGSDYE
jgi:segregation and condensation protein A